MTAVMTETILVLDLGTSRIKATLFDTEGRVLTYTSASYPTYSPAPGLAEQSPADWWAATVQAVRDLWSSGYDANAVRIVSVTGQMHGVVPVRADNTPLGPCLTLRDRRAADWAAHLRRTLGEPYIYRVTGARLDASSPPAKFLWYRYQTDFFPQIDTFLAPKDWLRQQLTGGPPITDPIEAAGMVIYDVIQAQWSPEMAEAAGIDLKHLPTVHVPQEVAGMLCREAAEALKLPQSVPVIVGAADDIEFIGAGLLEPGDCLEHLGSTGSLMLVVAEPVADPSGTLELYPHLLPGRWLIGGSTSSAGAALDWLRGVLKADQPLRVPSGLLCEPPIFVPYLAGERCPIWNPDARAVFWGLSMEHEQADLIRAAFEGVAFSLRHLLDVLCSISTPPRQITVATTNDEDWLNLRAAVYERTLREIDIFDPTALGSALLALCAIGAYPALEQAIQAVVKPSSMVSVPSDPQLLTRYHHYTELSRFIIQKQ